VNERDERLAVQGPAGPEGKRGEKGAAGLSGSIRRSLVVLFAIAVLLAGAGLFWAARDQHDSTVSEQRQQQARAICVALVGLDNASTGAVFAQQSATGVPLSKSYGYRLSLAIHGVVQATDCRALLAGKLPPT